MISNSLSVTIEGTASSLHEKEGNFFTQVALSLVGAFFIIPNFAIRYLVIPKIDKLTQFYAETCLKFQYLTKNIENSDDSELIDENMLIWDQLDDIKKALSGTVKSFDDLQKKTNGKSALFESFRKLNNVLRETYSATNQLQWAIAEHDASLVVTAEQLTADSAEKANELLERILQSA